jgi:hypothetical protein
MKGSLWLANSYLELQIDESELFVALKIEINEGRYERGR